MVVVSTASPYKFNGSVLAALGHETAGKDEFALLDELAFMNSDPTPAGLASLKTKTVRHQDVCEREEMRAFVRAFADK